MFFCFLFFLLISGFLPCCSLGAVLYCYVYVWIYRGMDGWVDDADTDDVGVGVVSSCC